METCFKSSWIFQFAIQNLFTEKQFRPYCLFKAVISAMNGLTTFNVCLSCVNTIF